ncbi:MAG: acetolactate synthase small subunit [Aurantimonas endophytica]|jgi:acetolactate synthase-1/3 small subunit|uniref:Acetolactate synthase small subunit n=1 Tax=Aurantimonas endophytica TaxID=1522175 RepID=A0A7W6HBQ2_9HYPH|nr:acetolactate synthase small subunit [Aurantimonas endophytica]MBB4002244.1 acetolactate synthase-1/3 small subunit [Aurantimonas endophytica]MCO6402130.1 acetolactate synthase small subunit [Aurantimonas endophytica]
MNSPVPPPASAYFITPEKEAIESRILAIIVDNEPGVLARVIGLFSGRGYNIESLTVSETEHEKHLSRITVVTKGAPHVIEQLKSQLDRIVPVHRVVDLTRAAGEDGESGPVQRELAIVKVAGQGEKRVEALRLADVFRAKVVDSSIEHFVFELTGRPSKLDKFVAIMAPLGLVEVCRTGVAALSRGKDGM